MLSMNDHGYKSFIFPILFIITGSIHRGLSISLSIHNLYRGLTNASFLHKSYSQRYCGKNIRCKRISPALISFQRNTILRYEDNLVLYERSGDSNDNENTEQEEEDYMNDNDDDAAFLDELFWNVEISDDDANLFKINSKIQSNDQVSLHSDDFQSINDPISMKNLGIQNLVPDSIADETDSLKPKLLSIADLASNNISPMEMLKLAPASQIAYFYLQSLGLSEDTMWKITTDAGPILGLTVPNLQNKIHFLQTKLGLSDDDIISILTRLPTILQLNVTNSLKPKLEFLERELLLLNGTSQFNSTRSNESDSPFNPILKYMVIKYPSILCYSLKNLQKKVLFFRSTLELSSSKVSKLLTENPVLLTLSVENNLQPKIQFFQNEVLLSLPDLQHICLENPKILTYSLRSKLFDIIISYFIMRLRMEVPTHVAKVLNRFPQILDFSLENHMLPLTLYFIEDLGLHIKEFRSILLKYPKIMTHSLDKIEYVIEFLCEELDLGKTTYFDGSRTQVDDDSIKRILLQAPQIIGYNVEDTIHSKIFYLQTELELDADSDGLDEIRKLIVGMPTLLLCSIEQNLDPKIQYLKNEFGLDMARNFILNQPALLGYSLEKRIQPRFKTLITEGFDPKKITTVLTMPQKKFEDWIIKSRLKVKNQNQSRERQLDNHKKIESDTNNHNERRSARIVHWNRERQ